MCCRNPVGLLAVVVAGLWVIAFVMIFRAFM